MGRRRQREAANKSRVPCTAGCFQPHLEWMGCIAEATWLLNDSSLFSKAARCRLASSSRVAASVASSLTSSRSWRVLTCDGERVGWLGLEEEVCAGGGRREHEGVHEDIGGRAWRTWLVSARVRRCESEASVCRNWSRMRLTLDSILWLRLRRSSVAYSTNTNSMRGGEEGSGVRTVSA
jgi:hypothetical protein